MSKQLVTPKGCNMAPEDLSDRELLIAMYREVGLIDLRLSAHLKFHSDVIRTLAWIAGSAVSLAALVVAAKAAGLF